MKSKPDSPLLVRTKNMSVIISLLAGAIKLCQAQIKTVETFFQKHETLNGVNEVLLAIFGIYALYSVIRILYLRAGEVVEAIPEIRSDLREALKKSGPMLSIIHPQVLEDFKRVFGDGAKIRAYNPPLTLLVHEEGHRDIIYQVLSNNQAKYQLLAGNHLVPRIPELYEKWQKDKIAKRKLEAALKRMQIAYYDHDEDLHSEIKKWGEFKYDLRGMSFFLVETRHGGKIVLLYLLGEPFVEGFNVPATAFKIWSVDDKNECYDELSETFDKRWATLQNVPSYAPQPLPDFVKGLSKLSNSREEKKKKEKKETKENQS